MIRAFSGESIDDGALKRILNAGRRAGSSKNLQRWRFIVVRDKERLRALSEVGPFAQHIGGAAVAVALVTPDPRAPDAPLSVIFDVGRAAQNMVLAAWDLGIGSAPATVYEHERARSLLGYPNEYHCEYLLSFGYPADPSELTVPKRRGGRNPLAEVVHYEHW
ncbi:MAG TPA: nitroreductase family protein [Actinomycetota bacterium]|nr:nitroreductase family protein [Actinomycetota bacterium]